MCRNEPQVHLAEQLPNADAWQGSELSVTILGNWPYYRAKILRSAPAKDWACVQLPTRTAQTSSCLLAFQQAAIYCRSCC